MILRRRFIGDMAKAMVLWLGLGVSLGWYYLFMGPSRAGWPMPTPESLSALVLYYFSALNTTPSLQLLHWLAVFPLAGLLWTTTLAVTAPYFGGRRVEFGWTLVRLGMTSLPLTATLPLSLWIAGHATGGFSLSHIYSMALQRAFITPPAWVTPIFIGLASASLVWQLFTYARIFDIKGKHAALHLLLSAFLLVIFCCGLATLASWPLKV